MKTKLMTFENLPIGRRFRWVTPPIFRGQILDGVYFKGAPTTFGDSFDFQHLEVTHEKTSLVAVAPSEL